MSTTYSAGIATAYGAAVRGGYTGTYEQWCALMADYADVGQRAEDAAAAAAQSQSAAAASETAAASSAASASTSEGNAAASATAAQTAQTGAEDAQTAAADSAAAAAQSATEAASSAATAAEVEQQAEDVRDSIPADYTTLSNDVTDLKNATVIEDYTSRFVAGGYYNLNKTVGTTVLEEVEVVENADYAHAVIPVKLGDIINIQSVVGAGVAYRNYMFSDNAGWVLSIAPSTSTSINTIERVWTDGYLYVNARVGYSYSVKRIDTAAYQNVNYTVDNASVAAIRSSVGAPSVYYGRAFNGTVANSTNANYVCTRSRFPMPMNGELSLQINRPLSASGNYYCFGWRYYDDQGNNYGTVNITRDITSVPKIVSNPNYKYVDFTIGEFDPANETWVTLRSTNFVHGDIVVTVTPFGSVVDEANALFDGAYGDINVPENWVVGGIGDNGADYARSGSIRSVFLPINDVYKYDFGSATGYIALYSSNSVSSFLARYSIENYANEGLFAQSVLTLAATTTHVRIEIMNADDDTSNYNRVKIIGKLGGASGLEQYEAKKQQATVLKQHRTGAESYGECEFKAMLVSDVHHESLRFRNVVDLMNLWGIDYFDALINCGDSVRTIGTDEMDWHDDLIPSIPVPYVHTLGNHDAYITLGNLGSKTDAYSKIIAPIEGQTGMVQPSNAAANGLCYYYIDFGNSIRVISVDCMYWDADEATWLENVLSDALANNKAVICTSHYSFALSASEEVKSLWRMVPPTAKANTLNIAAAEKVANFKTAGGTFLCWITGHQHSDNVEILRDYGNQIVITLPSLAQRAGNLLKSPNATDYNYNVMTYFSVDMYQHTIRFMRIGADIDTWGVKHEGLTLDYESGELIAAW